MNTTINTIRHARTKFGEERRYAGTLDVPLNARGRREARLAAEVLDAAAFDVIVTSTLARAVDTARILVGPSRRIVRCPHCNERDFGAIEGLTWEEVRRLRPRILFIKVGGDLHSVNPAGGEPFEQLWERARKFRSFLFRNYRGSHVLVVSHGVFLQQFHGLLRGKSCIESLGEWVTNLEMTSFSFQGNRLVGESRVKLAGATAAEF
ncbi:MAG: histidine phosphatase family protein [Candidatus Eisenbacteria bacterium]|nr:histidine phosphatase family protein [Candidatus Eisenbacteria bacterium]